MKNSVSLLLIIGTLLFTGCSARLVAEGELYYPKENQGNVYRSRAEFHRKSSWTPENMPEHWR